MSVLLTLSLMVACGTKSEQKECVRIIGECAELGTVEYTGDLRFQNEPARFEAIKPGPRIILYSAKVHIKAGVSLDDLSNIQVKTSPDGRSVTVTLPSPVIIYYKLEPKDVNKEFEKIGFFRWKFTNEEKLSIRKKAEQELQEQIEGPNPSIPILKDAERNARAEVELLLKATGRYDDVTVLFDKGAPKR